MLTHFPHYCYRTETWQVAYLSPLRPYPTAVCECSTEEQAIAESERLNEEGRRQQEAIANAEQRRIVNDLDHDREGL